MTCDAGAFSRSENSSGTFDGKNVSAISGSGEQLAMRIESQGIDDVVMRSPDAGRGTVGGDAVDIGAAAGSATGRREGRRSAGAGRGSQRHARSCADRLTPEWSPSMSVVEVPAGDVVAPARLLADAGGIDVALAIKASAVISFFGAL